MNSSSQPLHVLQLVRALDVGGLETVVVNLVNGLQETEGITVSLGCLHHRGILADAVLPAACWVGSETSENRFLSLPVLFSLCRFIRRNKIELIHSHNPVPHRYAVFAHLLTGRPVVHTRHGRNYPGNRRAVWLNRQYARLTKKIVAVSNDALTVAKDIEKIQENRLELLLNGIDTMKFSPVDNETKNCFRKERGIAADAFVVGSVGRLAKEKNYNLLLTAIKQACVQMPEINIEVALVGDGACRTELEQVAKTGLPGIKCHFPGMRTDIHEWLASFDVFCLSSHTEGTSMTLLEAGATGLPSVVTDVGGNGEVVIHDKTGLVVPPGNAEALANAFLRLAKDCELRKSMGTAAREHVQKHYSVDHMVGEYLKVYRQAAR
jgi:glycosyltransferase involved in cell wall biosynthesis